MGIKETVHDDGSFVVEQDLILGKITHNYTDAGDLISGSIVLNFGKDQQLQFESKCLHR